ncbi:UNVERIFIED_CONTAM: hypothetical protein PYX00_001014 [Menopon gallinae]|uniref:Uncharacterized protein n=1 Tax=Menopon gallinae TaxID=328185 RepID=A0AAW2IB60_9NEOP
MWLKGGKFSPGDLCLKMTFRAMKAVRFSKCCFVFTLRQGTMLIAVVELSLTSIMLFLLLLAAMNTQEIASMASAELQALENSWSSELGDKFGLPFYYTNNERKMLTGQHLATIMMTLTYAGVVLSIIHILSCLMLLYGALYDISNFLLPWLSTVLLSLVIASLLLTSFVFFHHHKCIISFYIAAGPRPRPRNLRLAGGLQLLPGDLLQEHLQRHRVHRTAAPAAGGPEIRAGRHLIRKENQLALIYFQVEDTRINHNHGKP